MARPIRIEYEGGFYHVTSRGNARQEIFADAEDYRTFLTILADFVSRSGVRYRDESQILKLA